MTVPSLNRAIHDDRALPALTGVRFFAALAVLISHYDQIGLANTADRVVWFLDGGRTAVTLFFVLSGFILAYNYENLAGGSSVKRFWIARLARIWPGVLLGLLIGVLGVVGVLATDDRLRLLEWFSLRNYDPVALAVSFASQVTMTTGWFPFARVRTPFNGPVWSITCEVLFYALFPLLIVWLRRMRLRKAVWVVVMAWLLQGALIASAPMFFGKYAGYVISTFPVTHVPEFLAGIVAALWYLHGGRECLSANHRRAGVLIGAAAAIFAVSAMQPVKPVYYLLTPPIVALILALATPSRRPPLLGWTPLMLLGEASYALYILHLPIGHLLVLAGVQGGLLGWLSLVATIAVSVVAFKFYETPVRLWLLRVLSLRKRERVVD